VVVPYLSDGFAQSKEQQQRQQKSHNHRAIDELDTAETRLTVVVLFGGC
jgi:hypothetical protein